MGLGQGEAQKGMETASWSAFQAATSSLSCRLQSHSVTAPMAHGHFCMHGSHAGSARICPLLNNVVNIYSKFDLYLSFSHSFSLQRRSWCAPHAHTFFFLNHLVATEGMVFFISPETLQSGCFAAFLARWMSQCGAGRSTWDLQGNIHLLSKPKSKEI